MYKLPWKFALHKLHRIKKSSTKKVKYSKNRLGIIHTERNTTEMHSKLYLSRDNNLMRLKI